MLERFDLIVFDWDGTLIDSTQAIVRAIQAAAADLDLAVPSDAQAAHVIGLGLHDALARAVPDLPAERIADFSLRYRHHYLAADATLELFAGARELLAALAARGLPLAVATGKSHVGLMRAIGQTGVQGVFAATRCADQTHSKPHPAMLLELADQLMVAPARLLMVGDTTHDLQMAAAAGAGAVGVAYGAHPREQLAACAPLALVDSVAQLRAWMRLDR